MLDNLGQWLNKLLGTEVPSSAPKPPFAASATLPATIADFIAATRMDSPQQAEQMGVLLSHEVMPWEFADFCVHFAKGVQYVHQRFGTVPAAIKIVDEAQDNPHYYSEDQTIYLPRKFIFEMLQLRNLRQSKTEPYILTTNQSAVMYGVEESYHHYQKTMQRDRYASLKPAVHPGNSGYTDGYDNHPLEYEAERVVRQALMDFGYDTRMYQMVPGTHPWTWRERVKPQGTPVAPPEQSR